VVYDAEEVADVGMASRDAASVSECVEGVLPVAVAEPLDTSCMTWAVLCKDSSLIFGDDGRVAQAVAA
jgi:hypothetical protein